MKKLIAYFCLIAIVALLAGCGSFGGVKIVRSEKPHVANPSVDKDTGEALTAGNSAFAFDLYKELRREEGNLFFSPYSISSALAMTYAGARGETETEMAKTLHFTLPQDKLHPALNATNFQLVGSDDKNAEGFFRLHIANALWGQKGYEYLPEFLDTLSSNYDAGMQTVDFAKNSEAARKTINAWVKKATEDKIEELLEKGIIDYQTRLVLTNAIYFKAKWRHTFEKYDTKTDTFHLLDGSQVSVPMMSQQDYLYYAQGDGWQAVELPYRADDFSMVILLPETGQFASFEASLDAAKAKEIWGQLKATAIELYMPKFTFESQFDLNDTLAAMGMPSAFDPATADFSGMTEKEKLFIATVIHKAFLAVDEEGTEAAAATFAGATGAAPELVKHIIVKIDRPFIFLIRDTQSGTVLFLGRVTNPAK